MCDTPHIVLLLPRPAARAPPAACCLLLAARTCLTLPVATTHATVATSPGAHTRTHTDKACETARCVQERFEVRGWRLEPLASTRAVAGARARKERLLSLAFTPCIYVHLQQRRRRFCALHQAPTHAHSTKHPHTHTPPSTHTRTLTKRVQDASVHWKEKTLVRTRKRSRLCAQHQAQDAVQQTCVHSRQGACTQRERERDRERESERARERARERERETESERERERERERMRMTC